MMVGFGVRSGLVCHIQSLDASSNWSPLPLPSCGLESDLRMGDLPMLMLAWWCFGSSDLMVVSSFVHFASVVFLFFPLSRARLRSFFGVSHLLPVWSHISMCRRTPAPWIHRFWCVVMDLGSVLVACVWKSGAARCVSLVSAGVLRCVFNLPKAVSVRPSRTSLLVGAS